jgi:hypothetical protein
MSYTSKCFRKPSDDAWTEGSKYREIPAFAMPTSSRPAILWISFTTASFSGWSEDTSRTM